MTPDDLIHLALTLGGLLIAAFWTGLAGPAGDAGVTPRSREEPDGAVLACVDSVAGDEVAGFDPGLVTEGIMYDDFDPEAELRNDSEYAAWADETDRCGYAADERRRWEEQQEARLPATPSPAEDGVEIPW